jgi:hypothetical protein
MNINREKTNSQVSDLQQTIYRSALFNLFLVTLIGLFLRSVPVTGLAVPYYRNILHSHSHFAFGGWVMPALLALIMKYFPELRANISYRHWRNIAALLLLSSYGMLFSFPFQGYAPVSISFSTLSILASFYLAVVIWRVKDTNRNSIAMRFLFAGLIYLVLSAAGPFATAPLIAMGKAGTPLYSNVIYFYLHFQYNGWFCFALLGVLYRIIGEEKNRYGNYVFALLNTACIPAYFLSTLWSHPPFLFYVLGGAAALLQLAALFFLLAGVSDSNANRKLHWMIRLALFAFAVKIILQLVGAFPTVANMAFIHRNFIIAYLHLVLLGFVSFFTFGAMHENNLSGAILKKALLWFTAAWGITELLLALQACGEIGGFMIPAFNEWLLATSCIFPSAAFVYWFHYRRR